MPRSKRKRIAEGVYSDAVGLAAVVVVGSGKSRRQREQRWPHGTPKEVLQAWRERTRRQLQKMRPRSVRGTLEVDVEDYVDQIQHLTSWRERRAELRAWTKRYAGVSRARLTSVHVRETMGVWAAADVAPKTINNRVQTLAMLYRALDGRDAPTPCDGVPLMTVHKTPPVAVSPAIVVKVARELEDRERSGYLRDKKTRARFMVLAATGRRPSEVMRTEAQDVDLERRVWRVRDGKGGDSPGVYLNDDMLAAWTLFVAAKAWGPFETSSFAKVLRSAGWPTAVRPYNLRHTVGITLSEAGVDLADIQAHMGHKRIATTRRFYVPVLASRMEAASRLLEGRFGWAPPQPAPPKRSSGRARRKVG